MIKEQIINLLLKKYPLNKQEPWDNSGVLISDYKKDELKNIYISLDVTESVIDECIKNNANLLISHHPLFLKNEDEEIIDVLKSKKFSKINKKINSHRITIISLHTNFDNNKNGMNYKIAKILELDDIRTINGICGVKGIIKNKLYDSLIKLNLDFINSNSNDLKKICNASIYFGAGACNSEIDKLLNKINNEIDVFISSEIKWHTFVDATEKNKIIVDIGHNVESYFIDFIYDDIKEKFNIESIKNKRLKIYSHKIK